MKKIFITMLAAVAAQASFAQNPDALKQVMTAEKKSIATNIMKEQEGTMTGVERALAYNHIVDMAIAENTKEQTKSLTAKDAEEKAKHMEKQYKAAYDAVKYAELCNVADNEPNEKGQVKPKFKKKNAARILPMRNDLINGGIEAFNSHNYANAQKWFAMFVDSHSYDVFSDTPAVATETQYPDVCYYAARAAYMNKDYKKATKYAEVAFEVGDEEIKKEALNIQLNGYDGQKTEGIIDGEGLIKKVKKIYKENPDNDIVFGRYIGVLMDNDKKEEANKVLANRLKENPNDVMANAYLAQNAQFAGDYDKAIDAYSKALAAKPDFANVKFNLATCYRNKAIDLKNNNQPYKELIEKAKALFQEIQTADPNEENFKTKYILSTIDEL